jgi:hypothetical protein
LLSLKSRLKAYEENQEKAFVRCTIFSTGSWFLNAIMLLQKSVQKRKRPILKVKRNIQFQRCINEVAYELWPVASK